MSNITMSPGLREHPVFLAQVSSFTRREKPVVETRNLDVTRISINLKSLKMTRN